MSDHRARYGPHNPDETYVAHGIAEKLVDLGEVQMNYATLGDASLPALLLIPGQTESWWGYEAAMPSPSISGAKAAARARQAATRSTTWATTWSASWTWWFGGRRS